MIVSIVRYVVCMAGHASGRTVVDATKEMIQKVYSRVSAAPFEYKNLQRLP